MIKIAKQYKGWQLTNKSHRTQASNSRDTKAEDTAIVTHSSSWSLQKVLNYWKGLEFKHLILIILNLIFQILRWTSKLQMFFKIHEKLWAERWD